MKNNSKSSIPWFILKEALLNWQSHLRIEFDLFYGFLSITRIWGKLGSNTLDHGLGSRKSNSKTSIPYFTSNEAILKCQGDLRFDLPVWESICTSNHMFGRVIWNKLPTCIYEIFEISQVKRRQFQNFWKSRGWFIPKNAQAKHVVTG